MMLIKVMQIGWLALMLVSFLLGLFSPVFAGRKTIWKALGLWGLGLGTGIAAVLLSLQAVRLQGMEAAAMRRAGQAVHVNDMPGYGQALLAGFGLMYFAAILGAIGVIFAISLVLNRRKRQRSPEAEA